ncbi:MAG: hypothetical protein AB7F09_02665 [Parvibaculaceae bacterium]
MSPAVTLDFERDGVAAAPGLVGAGVLSQLAGEFEDPETGR